MSKPAPSLFTDSFFSLQAVKGTMSPQFTEHICQVHVVVEKELVDQVAQGDMQVMTQKVTTCHGRAFFWKHFSKVEEVFLRLNQIYIGSVVDDYGLQFQVKKVFSSMMVHP